MIVCPQCGLMFAGMIGGAAGAVANGGNFGDVVFGMLMGAFSGAIAGAGLDPMMAFLIKGISGGAMESVQGGSFGHGFMVAGISGMGGGEGIPGAVSAMIIGGTVSEMTGGKFKNGAASAAFNYALQWGAGEIGSKSHNEGKSEEVPNSTSDGVKQSSLTDEEKAKRLKLLKKFEVQGGTPSQKLQVLEALSVYLLTDDGYSSVLLSSQESYRIRISSLASNAALRGVIWINFGQMKSIFTGFGNNNYIKNSVIRIIAHEMYHAAGSYNWESEVAAMIHENRVVKQYNIIKGTPEMAGERRFYASKYDSFNPPQNANYLE